METFVTHISLNSGGGGESVCLSLIKALQESGKRVTLLTVDKTDWARLNSLFGEITVPDREIYLFSQLPKTSSNLLNSTVLVASFWTELLFLSLRKKSRLIINTCGEKINSVADVSYLNGISLRCASLLKETNATRRCLSVLYNMASKGFDKINSRVVLVNSRFQKRLSEKCLKKTVLVVYPPVNVQRFKDLARKRRIGNVVVTYSQYVRTQNLDRIPKIAQIARKGHFLIIGPSGNGSKSTLEELQRMISELSVEERVKLLVDQPFSEYVLLLSTGKIFLRTLPYEPFGLSVIEAMAAGCVPIVPRNGGPWYDILNEEQGRYGYSYASIEEAAQIISMLLDNEPLRAEISARAQRRALDFENSHFEETILAIVDKIRDKI